MTAWFALYPHVGGGKGTYPGMQRRLRGRSHCHVPTLAGRDDRFGEPPLDSFASVADDLDRQLWAEIDAGRHPADLVLFGFSMGALLAAELAARLEQHGYQPRGLVVAGSPPPHLLTGGSMADLPDEAFIGALAQQGVVPAQLLADPELIAMLLPVWRADCRVVASHPRRPIILRCPVAAFGGSTDPLVSQDDLAVWARIAGPASTVTVVSGGHAALLSREDALLAAVEHLAAGESVVGPAW